VGVVIAVRPSFVTHVISTTNWCCEDREARVSSVLAYKRGREWILLERRALWSFFREILHFGLETTGNFHVFVIVS
jgi:hypothetical protein